MVGSTVVREGMGTRVKLEEARSLFPRLGRGKMRSVRLCKCG